MPPRVAWLAALAVTVLLPPQTAAQTDAAFPALELEPPSVYANGTIPVAPAEAPLVVPWTLKFPTPASAAAASSGETKIEWSLQCAGDFVTLRASPTLVPVQPPGDTFEGLAFLNVSAKADAPGLKPLDCTLQGNATAPGWPQPILGTAGFAPQVAFVGLLRIETPMPSRSAGPDKQVAFEIVIENLGNARTQVAFRVERPKGKWDVLVPDTLILDSGSDNGGKSVDSVFVTVSTSYHNGPNRDARDFVVHVTSASTDQPEALGQSSEVTLHSDVHGWYIPGPSPAMALVAVALACLVARRDV